MKRIILFSLLVCTGIFSNAQDKADLSVKPAMIQSSDFTLLKNNAATSVKNQGSTGTCWAFSTTSLLESQLLKNNLGTLNLSEMFTVRNIYVEKAKNYILRQGHAQFSEGGLGHDVIRAIANYGAMPDDAYSGLLPGQAKLDHQKMSKELKEYLDSILKTNGKPLTDNWLAGYNKILDDNMGVLAANFIYEGKTYTAMSFSKDVMHFDANDYVNLTSFSSQPYYQDYIVQVPDNFSNGAYYNLPLNEFIETAKTSLSSGYSLMWDADVSNNGFRQGKGLALYFEPSVKIKSDSITADMPEAKWNPEIRQQLYEELVTQDDHLMHITGIEKSGSGKTFFIVKNSWGNTGPFSGYINVSESYFAINTISLVVPKASLSKTLLEKLKIK
ncbi:MAG: C1 family peptidase [Ferruginibacter sp.]